MKRAPIFFYRLLEYYDKALYKLILPFIAPLFFPSEDPLVALALGYSIIPVTTLSRFLGAFFFGRLSILSNHKRAFLTASLGLGLCTLAIAFLPTYCAVGILAPCLLTLCRFGQSFFIAGQTTGGALLLLGGDSSKKQGFLSSCYESVAEIGALSASLIISLLVHFHLIESLWRLLFVLGSAVGIVAVFSKQEDSPSQEKDSHKSSGDLFNPRLFKSFKKHKKPFLLACLFSGFAYGNYALVMTLFIGLVPHISDVSQKFMVTLNSFVIFTDILLLPFFGRLCDLFGKQRVSLIATALLMLIATPGILFLEGASTGYVATLFFVLIWCGVAIVAPFYQWMVELAPKEIDYTFISLAKACGLQFIGAPLPALALALYRWTGNLAAIGLLYSLLAFSVFIATMAANRQTTSLDLTRTQEL